jgi:hypothetical protein
MLGLAASQIGIRIEIGRVKTQDDQHGRLLDTLPGTLDLNIDLVRRQAIHLQVAAELSPHPLGQAGFGGSAVNNGEAPGLPVMSGWRPQGRFQDPLHDSTRHSLRLEAPHRAARADEVENFFPVQS